MAAALVRNVIRITANKTDVFPAISSSESLVTPAPPAPLQGFIHSVITSQNSDSMPVRRSAAIGQAIIVAYSPRPYISSLLIILATSIHKKYGLRELTDILSSLGLANSYSEVVKLVNAQLKDNPPHPRRPCAIYI